MKLHEALATGRAIRPVGYANFLAPEMYDATTLKTALRIEWAVEPESVWVLRLSDGGLYGVRPTREAAEMVAASIPVASIEKYIKA